MSDSANTGPEALPGEGIRPSQAVTPGVVVAGARESIPLAPDASASTVSLARDAIATPPVPVRTAAVPKAFAAFQYRNYQLWFGGQLISLAGTWMQSIAQGWLVYEISKSEFALGLVSFASAIPILFVTPFGGVVVDRVPKRTLLVITQIFMMLLAFVLAALVFANVVQVWHVVVLAVLLGVANAFDAPARQSFIVEMVTREHLINGIAMNSIMFNGARVVGPAIGGAVLAAVGAGWCFLLNGVTFIAVIAGLLAMRVPKFAPPGKRASSWQQLKDGLHYTSLHKELVAIILLASVWGVFGGSYSALLPAFIDQVFHTGAEGYGFLNAAIGLGAMGGAFIIAQFVDKARRGTWLFFANQSFSILLLVFAFNHNFTLAIITGLGLGLSFMIQNTNMNSLLQTGVEDSMRGRVLSLYTLAFFGFSPIGSLVAGSLAQAWSLSGTVGLFAAITLVGSIFIFIRNPEIRKLV
jgi:MFS family permease